jgi:hypothetical protein
MRIDRSFLRDQSGQIAIITALAATLLTGIAGVAILGFQHGNQKTALQAGLDAGVLAGTALPYEASDSRRVAVAEAAFYANVKKGEFLAAKSTAEFDALTSKPVFSVANARVSGMARAEVENGLGAVLGMGRMEAIVRAAATKRMSDPICVLALNRTSPKSVEVYGNAELDIDLCALQTNSSSGQGLRVYGNQSAISATQVGVTGNYTGSNFTPAPITGTEPVDDPYSNLPVPEPGPCIDAAAKLSKATATLDPGTYCGGLEIKAGAHVTLNPGIYVMLDGQFKVNSGAEVTGEEVLIALVGKDSYIYLLSNAHVKLTSPHFGTYKNIQFMSDRDVSKSKFNEEWTTILSGARLEYDGVAYLPEQNFWVSGTGQQAVIVASSPSMIMVADKIWVQGNAKVEVKRQDKRLVGDDGGLRSFAYGATLVE